MLDYASYKSQLQTLVVSQDPDPAFDELLPAGIDYAEQRIYRELNLVSTVTTDTSVVLSNAVRAVSIPELFVVVDNINLLTPAGAGVDAATRVPLTPVSRAVLDMLWPGNSVTGVPSIFCMVDQWSIILGASPDDTYGLEIVGTYRPDPLSETNTTTFLTEHLPDLFVAASMVFMSGGLMRNFGAQQSDPAMSSSWEAQYGLLKASADVEELRKRFTASSWSSQPISPQAQPQRG